MDKTPNIRQAHHVHFTGIKGVGMAAAALCVQDLGIQISGSDLDEDFVTKEVLQQRNITPSVGFVPTDIPAQTDLLVYTGAHQGIQNTQAVTAQTKGIRVISHAQAVGELMQGFIGVSVCGVGGKTSTSAMLATILDYLGHQPSFLIGVGKVLNLQVPGRIDKGKHFIAEADEYVVSPGIDNTPRFSFHTPNIIICTNISHDHPDVYSSIDDTKRVFDTFFQKLPSDGLLVVNGNSSAVRELDLTRFNPIYYGDTAEKNDWWIKESFVGQGKQLVTFASKDQELKLTLSVPGLFNAKNALAAFIVAKHLGLDEQGIIQALQLFRGSMRRFEKMGEYNQISLYDDYAHHPNQIVGTLKAAREWLPLKRLVVCFQPHTFSRTKVLLEQFSKSFPHADKVIITDIYSSSREAVDESISGQILADEIKKHRENVTYVPIDQLFNFVSNELKPQDAFFTLGAGDIYHLHQALLSKHETT